MIVKSKLNYGLIIGIGFFVSSVQSLCYPIGARAHIEVGIDAVQSFIINFDNCVPGLDKLFKRPEIYSAFYAGCAFPDWGYGGINHDASEASHWNKFMCNYVEVLKEKGKNVSPVEFEKEVAFFLGVVVHNISDIPWHFDDENDKSFISSAREYGNTSHQDSEMALEMFLFAEKSLPYPIVPPLFYPYDTIMQVLSRCGFQISLSQLKAGCLRQQAYLSVGPWVALGIVNRMKSEHKWVYDHHYDYYYGGLRHCASAVSAFLKYYYSLIMGDFFIQRSHRYSPYVRNNNDYIPLEGIEDATVMESLPTVNTGNEPFLILSNRNYDRRDVLVRFALPKYIKSFSSASLWMYVVEVNINKSSLPEDIKLKISRVVEPWIESNNAFSKAETTNESGLPGVTWRSKPACAEFILSEIPFQIGWVKIDISKILNEGIREDASNNNSICISLLSKEEVTIKFYSSEAFRKEDNMYCGGDLLAYRPAVFVSME
ncbi:MAG: zinc dependent phospholipase C family protein [Candidatus Hydrogenedentes bacterium]|nr:zinc dependent phospholipase C family protein [Candidatus Hydrogenedentota bacterium]